jgi:hypothetical protein
MHNHSMLRRLYCIIIMNVFKEEHFSWAYLGHLGLVAHYEFKDPYGKVKILKKLFIIGYRIVCKTTETINPMLYLSRAH